MTGQWPLNLVVDVHPMRCKWEVTLCISQLCLRDCHQFITMNDASWTCYLVVNLATPKIYVVWWVNGQLSRISIVVFQIQLKAHKQVFVPFFFSLTIRICRTWQGCVCAINIWNTLVLSNICSLSLRFVLSSRKGSKNEKPCTTLSSFWRCYFRGAEAERNEAGIIKHWHRTFRVHQKSIHVFWNNFLKHAFINKIFLCHTAQSWAY